MRPYVFAILVIGVRAADNCTATEDAHEIQAQLLSAARAGNSSVIDAAGSGSVRAARGKDGNTVLHEALYGAYSAMQRGSIEGHLDVIRLSIEKDPKLLAPEASGPLCPLFHAVSLRVARSLKLLLSSDRDAVAACLRERDTSNRTVLMLSAMSQASGMARLFLAHRSGVPKQLRRDLGLAPAAAGSVAPTFAELTRAAGSRDFVALLDAGASPWDRDGLGRTVLDVAAMEGRLDVVRTIMDRVEKGVVSTPPEFGSQSMAGQWSAQQVAEIAGFSDIAELLAAVPGAPSSAGRSAETKNVTPSDGWEHRPSGGWSLSTAAASFDVSRCDIDVLQCEDLHGAEFNASFLAPMRPVLLAGCARGWPAQERWSREGLVERYGHVKVQVGPIAFPETYGLPGRRSSLADVVAAAERAAAHPPPAPEPPLFAFDNKIATSTGNKIHDDYTAPHVVPNSPPVLTEFSLGPPLSGANMHFHGAVFTGLVHGRKRWALLRPADAYFSTTPVREWLDSEAGRHPRLLHCIQRAGDVMFVPRNWGHAVMNLQTAVGVVNEY
mmetsp:Transcript_84169/g.191892  ORF Transcript_84169/g.191892 Transcript_84169/m.191892 type:complete len:552 (+) Transcript_84169:55-1710(+)